MCTHAAHTHRTTGQRSPQAEPHPCTQWAVPRTGHPRFHSTCAALHATLRALSTQHCAAIVAPLVQPRVALRIRVLPAIVVPHFQVPVLAPFPCRHPSHFHHQLQPLPAPTAKPAAQRCWVQCQKCCWDWCWSCCSCSAACSRFAGFLDLPPDLLELPPALPLELLQFPAVAAETAGSVAGTAARSPHARAVAGAAPEAAAGAAGIAAGTAEISAANHELPPARAAASARSPATPVQHRVFACCQNYCWSCEWSCWTGNSSAN